MPLAETLPNLNRSAVIMAVLLGFVKLTVYAVETYVPDPKLGSILETIIYDVGIALGVVVNTRSKPSTPSSTSSSSPSS